MGNVGTRNQPTRKVIAAAATDVANDDVSDDSDVSDGYESEFSGVHPSSEDFEATSDDSNNYYLTEVYKSMTGASDTELQDTDAEENQKRLRKANKILRKKK